MPRVRFKPLAISKQRWHQPWFSSHSYSDEYSPVSHDPEKAEIDWEDASSASSSRVSSGSYNSHQSHEHLLDRRKTRKPANAYQPRKTCNIYFTVILGAVLVAFILILWAMQQRSAAEVRSGVHRQEAMKPPWDEFMKLERYYGGLKSLVQSEKRMPEWPGKREDVVEEVREVLENDKEHKDDVDKRSSTVIEPRASGSAKWSKESNGNSEQEAVECSLDEKRTIRVPQLVPHQGIIRGFPENAFGLGPLFGTNDTQCFDRYGRLGPYGFGYSQSAGGIGAGIEGLTDGAEGVWRSQPRIDYNGINWSRAQNACTTTTSRSLLSPPDKETSAIISDKTPARAAILVRTTSDHIFNPEETVNLRSLISEASLATGGLFTVHILVRAPDDAAAFESDSSAHQGLLTSSLPPEFQGLGTLWSVQQMRLSYPNIADEGLYDSERGSFLPVQHFAHKHSEYDHFWVWDMESRYTGHVGELLQEIDAWSMEQPRKELWERNARFYVPAEHSGWKDYSQMVHILAEHTPADPFAESGTSLRPVWGPLSPIDDATDPSNLIEPSTSHTSDAYVWGVAEPADFISLSPIFDPAHITGFPATADVVGYNTSTSRPPRRATESRILRLSRRLLRTMHAETLQRQRYMAPEIWPASVALHYGLKAVYAPHAVYVDRKWPTDYLAAVLNTGADGGVVSGRNSVWSEGRRGIFDGLSFGASSSSKSFARKLYRRWLGYRDEETGEGGEEWEEEGEGRMCLPPMLLGGVGRVDLVIEE